MIKIRIVYNICPTRKNESLNSEWQRFHVRQ